MDLSSIFALMVLAGFPKVCLLERFELYGLPVPGQQLHREGSLVQVHTSDQPLPLAVLTSVDGDSGTVVSPGNREPQTVCVCVCVCCVVCVCVCVCFTGCVQVKLSQCEVEDTLRGCITHSELSSLLPLLHQCLQLSKQGMFTESPLSTITGALFLRE